MAWVLDDNRPIYTQLVEQLQLKIISGAYLPGTKLPGVRELAAAAAVNPNTMQKALAQLEKRGLIISQGPNGRMVSKEEQLIQSSRQELAERHGMDFFAGMDKLGYTRGQAIQFLQNLVERGEAKDECAN